MLSYVSGRASVPSLDIIRCVRSSLPCAKAAKMGDAKRGISRLVLRWKGYLRAIKVRNLTNVLHNHGRRLDLEVDLDRAR